MLHIFETFRSFTFQLFRVPALFAAFVLLICLTAAQLTLAQTYSQNIFEFPGSKFSPLAKVSDSSGSLANNNLTAKPVALPATLVVDDDGVCPGATFSTINAAVAAASPGDTIQVCAGTYNESVNVNKTLTILGAQSGVDARTRTGATGTESVINSTGTPGFDVGFNVTADGVVINGFTVQDGATLGIYLLGASSGYQILNNIIQNNTFGLYLNSSGAQQTIVRNNAFRTNNLPGSASGDGIYSDQSARVLVDANSFTGHAADSMIFLGTQSNITVSGNQLTSDNKSMVFLSTNGLVITRNTITTPLDEAIELDGGNNNVLINCNTIVGSPFNGISVENPHMSVQTLMFVSTTTTFRVMLWLAWRLPASATQVR
jgi:parallel beta-helix repeat protein